MIRIKLLKQQWNTCFWRAWLRTVPARNASRKRLWSIDTNVISFIAIENEHTQTIAHTTVGSQLQIGHQLLTALHFERVNNTWRQVAGRARRYSREPWTQQQEFVPLLGQMSNSHRSRHAVTFCSFSIHQGCSNALNIATLTEPLRLQQCFRTPG